MKRLLSSVTGLLAIPAAVAGGQDLLPQLDAELNALVAATRRHVVTVIVPQDGDDGPVRSVLIASGLALDDSLVVTAASVVTRGHHVEVIPSGLDPRPASLAGVDILGGVALLRTYGLTPTDAGLRSIDNPVALGDLVCLVTSSFEERAGYSVGSVVSVRPAGMNGQVTTEIEASTTPVPGSAGAVLVNSRGQLSGLVVGRPGRQAGLMTAGDAGVLAIPLRDVLRIADELKRHGKVGRNWLGVSVQEMTPALREILGVEPSTGVIIIAVDKDGPAVKSGLELGDVILRCGNDVIKDPVGLMEAVATAPAGSRLRFAVLRNGETIQLPVTLAELPIQDGGVGLAEPPLSYEERIRALETEISRLKSAVEPPRK
ncbi:PDZ domain-containing protein [Candidatus Fermentibacteria bacterium]|nr:PDZ domain-containing protein [Candidatus Fermentibacteria bacterium]